MKKIFFSCFKFRFWLFLLLQLPMAMTGFLFFFWHKWKIWFTWNILEHHWESIVTDIKLIEAGSKCWIEVCLPRNWLPLGQKKYSQGVEYNMSNIFWDSHTIIYLRIYLYIEYEKQRKYLPYCMRLACDTWFITDTNIYFICQDSVQNFSVAFFREVLKSFCPKFYMNNNNDKHDNSEITKLMKTMARKWQNGFHWHLSLMLNILLSMHENVDKSCDFDIFTLVFILYHERWKLVFIICIIFLSFISI